MLCLGAHADDIEIGAGATVARLAATHPGMRVVWVVFSAHGPRADEARASARRFLGGEVVAEVRVERFRDGFFPYDGARLKEYFERLKAEVDPDLVFTHRLADRHQDHRTVSELTWNTWRDHVVLEYEIPKVEGDLGQPNLYVPLSDRERSDKVERLWDAFESQRTRRWFRPETFNALMRIRGLECNAESGYAEAFHAHKMAWSIGESTQA